MERRDHATVATFYAPNLGDADDEVSLGTPAAHHAGVRRLAEADAVRLTDGKGRMATATITMLTKRELVVCVRAIDHVPLPPSLEVLPPVADRDRMLWLAEKCTELGITAWRPVVYARSRSVSPRGEGEAFAAKVRARMVAALEQSGGAWLPAIHREMLLEDATSAVDDGRACYVLHRGGGPMPLHDARAAAVTFGPEGGIDPSEHALLRSAGWTSVAIASTTLRFETAGIAAVAILRARGTGEASGD